METEDRTIKKASQIHVGLQIGKKGIREQTIKEIQKHLKKKSLLKIKLLRSSLDPEKDKKEQRDAIIALLEKKVPAKPISRTGMTFVLKRPEDAYWIKEGYVQKEDKNDKKNPKKKSKLFKGL